MQTTQKNGLQKEKREKMQKKCYFCPEIKIKN